jgi:hypothetical protein
MKHIFIYQNDEIQSTMFRALFCWLNKQQIHGFFYLIDYIISTKHLNKLHNSQNVVLKSINEN